MKTSVNRGLNVLALAALLLSSNLPVTALADTAYRYDELGRLKSVTYANGTVVTYLYDEAGNRRTKAVATLGSSFTQTIQVTGSGPVDLHALAVAAGYNDAQNANVTFEVGNSVTIKGDPGGGIGVDTGVWPTDFTITLALTVKSGGAVYGGGGEGGTGGAGFADYGLTSGGPGGDAVYVRRPISITVESGGAIKGGGNGGSGGSGGDWFDANTFTDYCWGGGGGGGGFPNGVGGAGGDTTESPYFSGCYVGNSGSNGTTSGGGAGGARLYDSPNVMGDGYAGGAAGGGYAVRKNGHTVTVSGPGTVTGTVN